MRGRFAIVTVRGVGCGGRGSVGPERRSQGASPEGGRAPCTKGALKGRRRMRDFRCGGRRRCAVRTGAEMCPIGIAFARRPKSCGPAKSGLLFARLQPQARSTAETTASGFDRCRGEYEASRKPTARGTPDDVRCGRGVLTRALFYFAHEAADAWCVRRSARPLL